MLRQVLEKLILNTFQSNPNQDVGLLLPDGSIHPVQAGLRMVETFRFRCQESVEADPLRPLAMVYEEKLSKIKAELADTESQADIEDFMSLCPTLLAMCPSLYRQGGIKWGIRGSGILDSEGSHR